MQNYNECTKYQKIQCLHYFKLYQENKKSLFFSY